MSFDLGREAGKMTPKRDLSRNTLVMEPSCKHPKVRVVSRQDDVEFVECEECGEIFDADEYEDMTDEAGLMDEEDEDAGAPA
jgi:hypothetical protein